MLIEDMREGRWTIQMEADWRMEELEGGWYGKDWAGCTSGKINPTLR